MKAVVYKGPFEVAVENVADPAIEQPADAVIRITTANICGSDLHPYEGRAPLIVSHEMSLDEAPDAYARFDRREDGWTKVLLHPAA